LRLRSADLTCLGLTQQGSLLRVDVMAVRVWSCQGFEHPFPLLQTLDVSFSFMNLLHGLVYKTIHRNLEKTMAIYLKNL